MSSTDTVTDMASAAIAAGEHEHLELDVSGMTCGSCAARVQRALSREPGVTDALVNYATGRASVELESGALDADRLIAAVAQGRLRRRPGRGRRSRAGAGARGARAGRERASRRGCCDGSWSRCRSRRRSRVLTYSSPHDHDRALDRRGARRAGPVLVRAAVPALRLGAGTRSARPTWTR